MTTRTRSAPSTWGLSTRQMRLVGRWRFVKPTSFRASSWTWPRSRRWPTSSKRGAHCCSISWRSDNQLNNMNIVRLRSRMHCLGRAFFAATAALLLASTIHATDAQPRVGVLHLSGVVDNVVAGYIHDGLARAASDGDAAALITIDTPG